MLLSIHLIGFCWPRSPFFVLTVFTHTKHFLLDREKLKFSGRRNEIWPNTYYILSCGVPNTKKTSFLLSLGHAMPSELCCTYSWCTMNICLVVLANKSEEPRFPITSMQRTWTIPIWIKMIHQIIIVTIVLEIINKHQIELYSTMFYHLYIILPHVLPPFSYVITFSWHCGTWW